MMFRSVVILILVFMSFTACKQESKENKKVVEDVSIQKEKVGNKEDYLVLESSLTKEDIKNASYVNVGFSNDGAKFDVKSDSYIKIPEVKLDFSKNFNVSFRFKFISEDGTKPQALFLYKGKYSSPSKAPLFVYLPSKKLSGVYGNQVLWAEEFDMQKGYSSMYYDSFVLSSETFYSVSINFEDNKIKFYVESELYAEYENLSPHSIQGNEVYLGAFPSGDEFRNQFDGTLQNLKIYSRALSEKEIIDLYNADSNF